jgi:uncharacterized protein
MKKLHHHVSRYLNIIDLDDDHTSLLFNGVNGCMDEVPNALASILASSEDAAVNSIPQMNLDFLTKRGHVTTLEPEQEFERFRELVSAMHSKRCAEVSSGGLLLLLSYNCNLACKYCYQQKHRPDKSAAVMTPEMVDDIFAMHLPALLPGVYKKQLFFYGGEPFLPSNVSAIRRALEHAGRLGISARAISNATLLDVMPDIFGAGPGKVDWIQVSIDGWRELHDSSRVAASGEATFDKIINNIKLLIEKDVKVAIRLNLDLKTVETTPVLLEYLQSQQIAGHENVNIYASPLHDNLCEVDATDFIDINGLAEKVFKFGIDLEHPVSLRANDLSYLFSLQNGTGLIRTSFCMQTMQNTLVIDPFGDIYGCFEEAGYTEMRVGHIGANGVEFFPLSDVYKTRHIANMPDCLACSIALTCGGQCGVMCRAKTGDLFKPYCADMKRVMLRGLKLAYKRYKASGMPQSVPQAAAREDVSVHG